MPIRSERIPPNPHPAVDLAGSGELVLFLHGIGGNRSNWTEQLTAIGGDFLACAWDARGYGDSDDYAGPLRFADFRNDVLRVLDHFAAPAAHLVGLSMGGFIAQDFFRCHPARVRSLTLADTRNVFQRSTTKTFFAAAKRLCSPANPRATSRRALPRLRRVRRPPSKPSSGCRTVFRRCTKSPISRHSARRPFAPTIPSSKALPGSSSLQRSMFRRL